MKLSAYTLAANCSDLNDLECGRIELNEAIQTYIKSNRKVPYYLYIRLDNICKKMFIIAEKNKNI